ncbi:glycosyltransferase [Kineococcus sp. R86509]|uniref:glycosyltransferase n=1 Tax=Kineococcus sp. R86509 TaxID=3093851 RepID=UPI0036D3D785
MTALERMVVVVPARDEERTIAAAVTSVLLSAGRLGIPVDLVVVADLCRDATAENASAAGAHVIRSRAGNVGAARAAGVDEALAGRSARELRSTWIACTDADSVVPGQWLPHHRRAGDAGIDLLLGTVRLAGPVTVHTEWRRRYAAGTCAAGHRHVHGANLGVRASTYRAAGGFPSRPAHEDREFVDRVRALPGANVLSSTAHPVLTSDRLLGRTPAGVAHDLSA